MAFYLIFSEEGLRSGIILRGLTDSLADLRTRPTAVAVDSRVRQWTLESDIQVGYEETKWLKGREVRSAEERLGSSITLHVIAANVQDRKRMEELVRQIQEVMGQYVEWDFVDSGYTSNSAVLAVLGHRIWLKAAKPGGFRRAAAGSCLKRAFTSTGSFFV